MSRHPNLGSSLTEFLNEEGIREEATATAVKRVIAWQLRETMKEKRITKTAMAAEMATSRQQLNRVLNPDDGNVTIETLQRAAKAVGKSLRLELV
jgi:DNA-binding Xre family transcriptional regulator